MREKEDKETKLKASNFKQIKTTVTGFLLLFFGGFLLYQQSSGEFVGTNSLYYLALIFSGVLLLFSPDTLFGAITKLFNKL